MRRISVPSSSPAGAIELMYLQLAASMHAPGRARRADLSLMSPSAKLRPTTGRRRRARTVHGMLVYVVRLRNKKQEQIL
jgi:hypothetical protein